MRLSKRERPGPRGSGETGSHGLPCLAAVGDPNHKPDLTNVQATTPRNVVRIAPWVRPVGTPVYACNGRLIGFDVAWGRISPTLAAKIARMSRSRA